MLALSENDQYQQVRSLKLEENVVYKVWLKSLTFPVQLLKKVFKNETTGTLYLVSNDMNCSAERLMKSTKNGGKLKSFINQLSKMLA